MKKNLLFATIALLSPLGVLAADNQQHSVNATIKIFDNSDIETMIYPVETHTQNVPVPLSDEITFRGKTAKLGSTESFLGKYKEVVYYIIRNEDADQAQQSA